jgi:hypothetical protein
MKVQLHARRSFTEAQLWAIVYHRYENLEYFDRAVKSYAQIADLLDLKAGTVAAILKRFKSQNNTIHMARKHNGKTPTKITHDLADYILAESTF